MAKREARVTLTSLDRKIDVSVDKLDKKVDRLDRKIDVKLDEAKLHASVLFEATREQIQEVAEGVTALNEKVDQPVDRTPRTESDVDMLKLVYRDLDRSVTHLEEGPTHEKGWVQGRQAESTACSQTGVPCGFGARVTRLPPLTGHRRSNLKGPFCGFQEVSLCKSV